MNIAHLLRGLRTKKSAARVIVISGDYGKTTTATVLGAILGGAAKSVTNIAVDSQASLAEAKTVISNVKHSSNDVIIEVIPSLLDAKSLRGVTIDCLVLTSDVLNELWKHLSVQHLVAPEVIKVSNQEVESYQRVAVGETEAADARIEDVVLYRKGTEVTITLDHQTKLELAVGLSGQVAAWNVASAVAAAYVLGADVYAIQEAIADIDPLPGRFEYIGKVHEASVAIDRATHSVSRRLAIASARQLTKRRLIVGIDASSMGDTEIDEIATMADRLFMVGSTREGSLSSKQELIKRSLRAAMKDDFVLLLTPDIARQDITDDQKAES